MIHRRNFFSASKSTSLIDKYYPIIAKTIIQLKMKIEKRSQMEIYCCVPSLSSIDKTGYLPACHLSHSLLLCNKTDNFILTLIILCLLVPCNVLPNTGRVNHHTSNLCDCYAYQ